MSSRSDRLRYALSRALIIWLLSVGLTLPLLQGLGLFFLRTRCMLLCGGIALVCALLSLKRFLLGGTLLALLAGSIARLLLMRRGFWTDTWLLLQAFILYYQGAPSLLLLYGDVLCMQAAVFAALAACFVSSPDTGTAPALMLVSVVLILLWTLGLRQALIFALPVLPALLLLYALTHRYEAGLSEDPRTARLSPLLIPVAAALLGTALLLTPAEGTRSAALAQFNEQLRETIEGRFFFRQERARFTLEADGWMPLGEGRLGGPADPSDAVVMQVETGEAVYLRGAILDAYTGAAWYDSVSAQRYYWYSLPQRALREEITQTAYPLAATLPLHTLTVHFASSGASTLFVPQRLRELTVGERMLPYFNRSSELFITRNLQSGDQYTAEYVSTKATNSGMAALAASHAVLTDAAYDAVRTQYTVLPSHIQQEVFDIAAAATAGCASDWQKATALRDYLRTHYRYTLDTQIPPQDVDFVAWFLLAEQQGYCTYFASAMTVLCRAVGLPARYVIGYVARPDATGVATVRGLDAHAWTEVYLNGLGWITFDATPSVQEPDQSSDGAPAGAPPSEQAPQEQQTPTPAPQPSAAPSNDPDASEDAATPTPPPQDTPDGASDATDRSQSADEPKNETSWGWLWLLLLALLCLLAWRIRVTEPTRRAARAADPSAALLLLWQAILRCAGRLKLPMQASETPLAYGLRAERVLGIPLRKPAAAVSALRYGRHDADTDDVAQARQCYLSLHERLTAAQKLLLALRRAFSFKK